jgi:hypothetical protein
MILDGLTVGYGPLIKRDFGKGIILEIRLAISLELFE